MTRFLNLATALLFLPAVALPQPQASLTARAVVERVRAVRSASSEAAIEAQRRRAGTATRDGRLALLWIASANRRRYRYAESDAAYQRLAGADNPDPDVRLQALLGQGQSQLLRWRVGAAAPLLREAAMLARAQGDGHTEGEALLALASLVQRTGSQDSARTLLDRAAHVLPAGSAAAAGRLCSQASILRSSNLKAADSLMSLGLTRMRALADTAGLARCFLAEASVLESRGNQGESIQRLVEGTELARVSGDRDLLAIFFQWRAFSNVTYGRRLQGTRILADSAIRIAREVGNPITAAWARLNLAQLGVRGGDANLGVRAASAARAEFRTLGDLQGELSALVVHAQALMASQRLREGIGAYARLESLYTSAKLPNAVPYYQIQRATALISLGALDPAERLLDSASVAASARGLSGLVAANIPYARGLLALGRGRYREGIEHFRRFQGAVRASAARQYVDADLRIAQALAQDGQFARAESVFAVVNDRLDLLRRGDPRREDVLRLLSGVRFDPDSDLGIATTVAAFVRGGEVDAAFGIAESERARWLWTLRAQRNAAAATERQDGALDDGRPAIAEIQGSLDERTAVITYTTGWGGEPTTSFAIWSRGVAAVALPPIDSLAPAISRFAAVLEGDGSAGALARSLGSAVLDPVLRQLPTGITHLRIVADGALHHLPFDALAVAGGTRVLERFVVSLAPSARLAVAPTRGRGGRDVLALGDPVFAPGLGLPRLPGSAVEVKAVLAAARGNGQGLLREEARLSALRARDWTGVGVLHLATHARVQDWGLFDNAIYLTPESGAEDGRLGAADVVAARWDVDLVVLSACRTAGGAVLAGEGTQGLVAPVLEAGARAVAVTLWNVRDRAMVSLMREFYTGMARGETARDALAGAKRIALRSGAPPSLWAAVTLVGDGGVRPLVPNAAGPAGTGRPSEAWSRPPGGR